MSRNTEPFDGSNPEHVAERVNLLKAASARQENMMKTIMSTPEGREWIWSVLEFCGVYRTPFNSNGLQMAHEVGKMTAGQKILADVMLAGNEPYLRMAREAKERSNEILTGKIKEIGDVGH